MSLMAAKALADLNQSPLCQAVTWSLLCTGLEKDLSRSYKDTGYDLMMLVTSADPSPSLEALLTNAVTLEVRASTYKLRVQVQSTAVGKPASDWELCSCDACSREHNLEREWVVQEGTVVLGTENHRGVQRLRGQGTGPRGQRVGEARPGRT